MAVDYNAKLARKKADIESDYQKALKRAGDDAAKKRIVEAKRKQRMADAADDFAKWTKADRSKTRAAKKSAISDLRATRRNKGAAPAKPAAAKTKGSGSKVSGSKVSGSKVSGSKVSGSKPVATPKKGYDDMSFRAAFRQAMKDKGEGKTFNWKGTSYALEYEKPAAPKRKSAANAPTTAPKRKPTAKKSTDAVWKEALRKGPSGPMKDKPAAKRSTDAVWNKALRKGPSGPMKDKPAAPTNKQAPTNKPASRQRDPMAAYKSAAATRRGDNNTPITVTASRGQVDTAKNAAREKARKFLAAQQKQANARTRARGQRPATFAKPTDAQLDRVANQQGFKKGGPVRGCGCAKRGLTKGKMR